MRKLAFTQIDVFTSHPLQGNQLAVFPDAGSLSDVEMQAIAREMNLSETTFILPRDPATEAREGVKTRIFTVEEELPFAGHPTLGTAFYVYSQRHHTPAVDPAARETAVIFDAQARVTLDLPVGKIPVQFSSGSDGLFGEMRQRDPEFGPTFPRDEVARAIGIAPDELDDRWPIQAVSTGVAFTIVPFRRLETLQNLRFAFHQAADYLESSGAKFLYFICPQREGNKLKLKARMIFYNGEDPATGSAAGPCAAWAVKYGIIPSGEQVLLEQGVEMQRRSRIFLGAERDGDKIVNVRVGGHAVEVVHGEVLL
jgi:trans-2,3-dihydro-3-hydroxyanthranilate isomerase